jgi:large repetitive protein
MNSSRLLLVGSWLLLASLAAAQAPLTITTPSPLPAGWTLGPYYQTLSASGGSPPYAGWSVVEGTLPPGLTLGASNGAISGTPNAAGAYSFVVQVRDSVNATVSKSFVLNISSSGGTVWSVEVGQSFKLTMFTFGGTGPFTWTIISGQIPPGTALGVNAGQVTGTPTAAGSYSFTPLYTDSLGQQFTDPEFTLNVYPQLLINSVPPLPYAIIGVAYSQPISVSGGIPPYTASISAGSLPPGLTFDPENFLISGTPTAVGTSTFTFSISDSYPATAGRQYTLTVVSFPTITTVSPLPNGTAGAAYSQTFAVTGGITPYTWTYTGTLPPGLALGAAGVLSGTPTQAGTFNFTVGVADASGSSTTKAFSLTVNAATLRITTASPLPNGAAGSAYSQTFAVTGGIAPYTWSISAGTLPPGLALGAAGVLSGTPTQVGTFNFTVRVADASGSSTTKAFSLTVTVPAAPTLSVTGLTDTATPAEQPTFDVQLSAAYALTITGTITLTFTPNAVNAANDPAIQFSSGGRTLNFTITAGQTGAFPTTLPSIQTGTVAGQIDLTLSFSAGGQDITPKPAPVRSVTIARAAPKINSVQVVKVTGGFNVLVTGYSTPRQVMQATFTLSPSTGGNLQTTQVTVPVDSAFTTWYAGASSAQYGSSFLYTQPFAVVGNVGDIVSVSVTLSNATGTSAAVSANF